MNAPELAKVGDVIRSGEAIPDNVVEVKDDSGDTVALNEHGHWHTTYVRPNCVGREGCGVDLRRYMPLTVTAVREPDPICDAATCKKPGHHHDDVPTFHVDEIFPPEPEPSAESVPDVLDLVRQYGDKRETASDMRHLADREALAQRFDEEAGELLGQIRAEVQRLRDNRCSSFSILIELLGAENLTEAKREVQCLRDAAADYAARLKATDRSWTEVARERDEALTEVERLKEAVLQADIALESAHEELIALRSQPDPRVLSLPQVPEGAILIGARTQRHWIWSEAFRLWVTENDKRNLGDLLSLEREVEVRLAPPREPRTWPKLDDEPEIENPPAVVDVGEEGRWRRVTEPGAERLYAGPGREGNWRLSLRGLRFLGDVTEVFDDEAGTR